MNRFVGISLVIVLLAISLLSHSYSYRAVWIGLSHSIVLSRETLLIFFTVLLAMIRGVGPLFLVALIVGSFFSGPLVTSLVAGMIVYERAKKGKSWWFLLKDIFFMVLLVLACGLPEPLRSFVTFLGVVGLSLDFDLGLFFLAPAVVFAHTTQSSILAAEPLFILTGIFVLLHLFWVWVNGVESARHLWKNAMALLILSGSFLIPGPAFLPVIVVTVLLTEIAHHLKPNQQPKQIWVRSGMILIVLGMPFFVGQMVGQVLMEKGLLWAIPILPLMVSFVGLSEREEKSDNAIYPFWALALSAVIALNGFWWSSTFAPLYEDGKWGWSGSTMQYLFESAVEEKANLSQEDFLISLALTLLGGLLGLLLFRFFKPNSKLIGTEKKLNSARTSVRTFFRALGRKMPEGPLWISQKYHKSNVEIDHYLSRVVFGFVGLFVVLMVFYRLKNGANG